MPKNLNGWNLKLLRGNINLGRKRKKIKKTCKILLFPACRRKKKIGHQKEKHTQTLIN